MRLEIGDVPASAGDLHTLMECGRLKDIGRDPHAIAVAGQFCFSGLPRLVAGSSIVPGHGSSMPNLPGLYAPSGTSARTTQILGPSISATSSAAISPQAWSLSCGNVERS